MAKLPRHLTPSTCHRHSRAAVITKVFSFSLGSECVEKKYLAQHPGQRILRFIPSSLPAIIAPGGEVMETESCDHRTVMKGLCGECGADLRAKETTAKEVIPRAETSSSTTSKSASVAMVHSIPELMVTPCRAKELALDHENFLLRKRKLVLLLDLDQTVIHTTNLPVPENLKDVRHFRFGPPPAPW